MAVSPQHDDVNEFENGVERPSFHHRKSSTSSRSSFRNRSLRAANFTGRNAKRGLEWLFGIEPAEDDNDSRLKWEARQRRLHRLRTDKQLVPSPTSPTTYVLDKKKKVEPDADTVRGTGRDPNNVFVVPTDPKPDVWTLAWHGAKRVVKLIWEGRPPPVPHKEQAARERFFEYEDGSEEEDDETDFVDGMPKIKEHNFFGVDAMDYPDGRTGRLAPPRHISRQQPIAEVVEVRQEAHNREFHGLGLAGKLLRFSFRPVSGTALDRLDKLYQHRPFFTYWVSFVQLIVMIVVSAVYGFAPYGFDYQTETALIQRTNLGIEPATRTITTSVWGGPTQEDLVLLGARYAPCMRKDERLFDLIEEDRIKESKSGCCIRNDDSGCVQVNSASECSSLFAQFSQNDTSAMPSGVVCGQSPRTCTSPKSQEPHRWPDDITKWPRCRESPPPSNRSNNINDAHLNCEVTGRPCCIGILAKCVIATLDFCNFMKGRFHEEATLCSQVNCLDSVCGLIPFVDEVEPDQFYRIWLSLFLHAGWVHLIFTFFFHFLLLRDVEKHIGWFRVGIIYLGSGFAGNIFSGIFIPYLPVVGPAGSIMGIISTLLVYVRLEWKRFKHPWYEVGKLSLLIVSILILGLFPFVDNFAHIGGLVSGLFLSAIFMPYYSPYSGEDYRIPKGEKDKFRRIKIILVAICIPALVTLYVIIFVLFYEVQPNCYGCQFITCIPFTDTICQDQRPSPDNRDMNL